MTRKWFLPALALSVLAAAAVGFGASRAWDTRTIEELKADRDAARDCRRSGSTVAPCPVIYKNTKTEWRDKIETVQTPDRKQAQRISFLSAELARTRRIVRVLQRARAAARTLRATAAYIVQNGSMGHPYNTSSRCPAGTVVLYDASLSVGNITRRSGDPNVCYVRARLHSNSRLALYSRRR